MLLEPDVFWSDIVLGCLCAFLGMLLLKKNNSFGRIFIALSFATVAGAFYHGLINTTVVWWGDILWTLTLFLFASTSAILVDEAYEHSSVVRKVLIVAVVVYMGWAIFVNEAFLWALLLQAVAILILGIRYAFVIRPKNPTSHRYLDMVFVSFICVNIVAILLQQMKINFGLDISHNTIFHIIELPVVVLLFLFLRKLRERSV